MFVYKPKSHHITTSCHFDTAMYSTLLATAALYGLAASAPAHGGSAPAATGLAYFSLGCFWTSEIDFECDKTGRMKGLATANDTHCPTGNSSVSDHTCVSATPAPAPFPSPGRSMLRLTSTQPCSASSARLDSGAVCE